jgi:uncharacterized membrane protein HdeD (DUF308 family)
MTAEVMVDAPAGSGAPPRWLFILSGILWLILSLMILSFDATSVATIGYMMAFVLIFAGVAEFMAMGVAIGWKWLHAVLGVLFVLTGIASLMAPFQTFGYLTLFIGWFLLIKGFFDIALSIGLHRDLPLWGLTLAVGIAEVLLGLWALGYPGRSAWLLVLWVGFGAMMRGIGDLVLAFSHGGSE